MQMMTWRDIAKDMLDNVEGWIDLDDTEQARKQLLSIAYCVRKMVRDEECSLADGHAVVQMIYKYLAKHDGMSKC